LLSTDWFHERI